MSSADWYKTLLEKHHTTEENDTGDIIPRMMKVERARPDVDWTRTWGMLNTKGLRGDQTSFLMKILYNILPTKGRLSRILRNESPVCSLCSHDIVEDTCHAFLQCEYNTVVNDWLVAVLIDIDPEIHINSELTGSNIIALNLEVDPNKKLAVLSFLATAFQIIWNTRQLRKEMSIFRIRSLIEAEVSVLSRTKYQRSAQIIESALNFMI